MTSAAVFMLDLAKVPANAAESSRDSESIRGMRESRSGILFTIVDS